MENNQYYDTYYGKKVSEYGLKNGYVDYRALSEAVGTIPTARFRGVLL